MKKVKEEKRNLAGYRVRQIHIRRKFGLEALEVSVRVTGFFSRREVYLPQDASSL